MANKLLKEFNITKETTENIKRDYEIFQDKELLDALRIKIITNIIDKDIPKENATEFIDNEVSKTIEGYDLTNLERSHLFNLIEDEINGYGPIRELLEDDNITEIMINSPEDIYIEINGKIIKDESVSFINNEHIIRTVQRLIQPLGKTINENSPIVESRLDDGSRINAIISPLSAKGPVVTIRKFQKSMANIEDLIRIGALTPWMARFLEAAVKARLNIIVCGSSGSGKTSLLNILSNFINNQERVVTIEDAAELNLKQEHVIPLITRKNSFNDNNVTIQDLVINSLRMRPDRIIVGEVRGKEAFDMIQAMNTGHDGSMTTLHANSAKDAIHRLETMILMAGIDIKTRALREYIESGIDLVINIERLSDGKRKITSISEIDGFYQDEIYIREIFSFKQKGLTENGEVDGEYALVETAPAVFSKIKRRGIDSLDDMLKIRKESNQRHFVPYGMPPLK